MVWKIIFVHGSYNHASIQERLKDICASAGRDLDEHKITQRGYHTKPELRQRGKKLFAALAYEAHASLDLPAVAQRRRSGCLGDGAYVERRPDAIQRRDDAGVGEPIPRPKSR